MSYRRLILPCAWAGVLGCYGIWNGDILAGTYLVVVAAGAMELARMLP